MKTFSVQTLGCKVNHYESDQLAALLVARGLVPAADPRAADLRVVNTCSVTTEAAAKSRQQVRRAVRLPLLRGGAPGPATPPGGINPPGVACGADGTCCNGQDTCGRGATGPNASTDGTPADSTEPNLLDGNPSAHPPGRRRPRVLVTGCWATGDRAAAASLPGVDAVLTHHGDVAAELDQLLANWQSEEGSDCLAETGPSDIDFTAGTADPQGTCPELPSEPVENNGWMNRAGTPGGTLAVESKASGHRKVNEEVAPATGIHGAFLWVGAVPRAPHAPGTTSLPLLGGRQTGRQRAFLKIQDGCDAHCTYCIIPRLRPNVWSKPVEDAVGEAARLVAAGHVELVLTGIFLGAYGQPTALRRRQHPGGTGATLARLVDALCTRVPGLRRLRLSSLEPGDLTADLIAVLRAHPQVVPHFHLPLQSGSDALLRRMNRQYGRDEFLRMIDRVRAAFDRPALTTDVIAGFPGETDTEFHRTLEVVDHARFIHVHAFPFSPRPGTAAARWTKGRVPGPVVSERIAELRRRGEAHGFAFRQQFLGETVELLIERDGADEGDAPPPEPPGFRHGRCERYFDVWVEDPGRTLHPGDFVRARVERVSPNRTFGAVDV